MAEIRGPQSQAGIFNFYDAPDKGMDINLKVFLILIIVFAALIIVFDHFL